MDAFTATLSRARSSLLGLIAAALAIAATVAILIGTQLFSTAGARSTAPGASAATLARAGITTDAYEPHQLVVELRHGAGARAAAAYIASRTGLAVTVSRQTSGDPSDALLQLPAGAGVEQTVTRIDRLAARAPFTAAIPDYIATAAGRYVPNDQGNSKTSGGWQKLQWNFDPRVGIDVPGAWGNLIADGRPGASGVKIAVIDSGVAFENFGRYKKSPDFAGTSFVDPCNLVNGTITKQGVCTNTHANDHYGHGTFVAGEIAEATNNKLGLTGIAYGASIMPVRVLNYLGQGSQAAVGAGIRYAVDNGAQVINLSLDFDGVTAKDIPAVISAISYARSRNVTVVGVTGNDDGTRGVDWPAADPKVIAVGGTTYDLCLAQYSNWGNRVNLVAPGGSDDRPMRQKGCNADRSLPGVYQMDFIDPAKPGTFRLIPMFGTSMAAAEVSAAVAMVIASGVIGPNPTPAQLLARLEATARPLGGSAPNKYYGYGLINIDAATSPGGPTAPADSPASP